MRFKQLLTKTFLVAAGLLMGSANAWATGTSAGAGVNDFSTGWWSDFTDLYTLNGNGTYEFNFTTTNVNDGETYKTWLLIATNGNDSHGGGGTEYFVFRGDGYAWGQGKNSNEDATNLICSNTYSTANPTGAGLQSAMNGATVSLKVYRMSNALAVRATVTPTLEGENAFTMSFDYRYANVSSTNIGLCFSVQNAYMNITSATYTSATQQVYDFKSYAGSTGSEYTDIVNAGSGSYKLNKYTVVLPGDVASLRWHGNYAFQFVGESGYRFRYKNSNGGLYNASSDRYFAIQEVKAGDAITITYGSFQSGQAIYSKSSNLSATYGGTAVADNVSLTSGATYYVISDASHLDLNTIGKGIRIESIKIDHVTPETVTAPSMEMTSVGEDYTTITITAGTASYGDAVTTYYTTDGSTPTTSSSSFTGATGTVNVTVNGTTIKAYSVVTDTQSSTNTAPASTVTSGEFDAVVAFSNAPTFAFKSLNGTSRTYTITNNNDEGTLYYTTAVANDEPAIGDAAYTALAYGTSATVDVEVSASGNLYAYAILADGTTTSTVTSQAVEAVALTLATPTYSVSGLTRNDNGTITGATFTITDPGNTSLLGSPTATLHYTLVGSDESTIAESDIASGGTYSPTAYGTLTITSSATGYTSSSVSLPVSNVYVVNYTSRDYTTTAPDDLATNWTASESWSELGADVYSRGATYTIDHIYNVNTALEYIEGWGMGRDHDNALSMNISGGVKGYLEVFKLNASANSGKANADIDATPSYSINFDYSDGNKSYSLPKRNIIQQHYQYKPAPTTVSATIGDAGAATLVSPYALNFTGIESVKAYYASAQEGADVTFTRINGTVAANTPLYVTGTTTSVPVVAMGTTVGENLLVAGTGAAVASVDASGNHNFILNKVGEVVGFYKAAGQNVAVGKAYLSLQSDPFSVGAKSLNLIFDGETTGISDITRLNGNGESMNDMPIYNLSGQRIAAPQKGINIVNGKKFIVK